MRLRYSARADRQLEAIGDWIANDNPVAAITFVEAIRDACRTLAQFPTAFPLVAGTTNMHRYLFRRYIIYYRVTRSEVTIVSILHGAQEQPAPR